ncbi:MAG TPA: hypothetical protein VN733_01225 [Solirubrobacterales bacterium]|nr:hypothetical protein [Solirubrobacterales bacterium]
MERNRAKAVVTLVVVIAASLVAATATFGQRKIDLLPPDLQLAYTAKPAPTPAPSEGRIPIGLRLAASISFEDGSHPPAATRLRFEFTRQFGLDLTDLPTCPRSSLGPRSARSPCEEVRFAAGRSTWEVAFPGQERFQVEGRTIAYKIGPRRMAFRVFLPAPVVAEVLMPVQLTPVSAGSVYKLRAEASIPKVAGGAASLLHLGLRFRKGVFSLACSQRRLQSRLTADFADGTRLSVALLRPC